MSVGWGSAALLALPCVGGGTERSKGSLELVHQMKNSVSGSWVVASAEATVCEGVCAAASRSRGGMGREHAAGYACVGGGTEPPKGSSGEMHPRKNSASGSWVEASAEAALCGKVCVASSRSKVGLGCGCGGEALKRLHRSKNSANESCVAASASVADITTPVTIRVGLA